MEKSIKSTMIIRIAIIATLTVVFLNMSTLLGGSASEVHAFGSLYATKTATCWDSTVNTKNASSNQTVNLPKASTKTTYKTISKKSTKTTAAKAKKAVNAAKKNKAVWEKTSYQWNKSTFQRITTYRETVVKASCKGKKATLTTTVRTKTVTETFKHFKKEYTAAQVAPLADKKVTNAFQQKGWKMFVNTNMQDNPDAMHYGSDNFLTGLATNTTLNGKAIKQIDVRVPEVAYHELGHFVALETGRSDLTSEFKSIMKGEYGRNGNTVKPHTVSAEEYFADAFAAYCENPSKLKSTAPKTFEYIQKQIKAL